MLRSACGAVEATLLEFDDLTALDPWTRVLSGMLGESAARIPARAIVQSSAVLVRALLVRNPGSPELDEWLAKAERAAARDSVRTVSGELRTSLALTHAGACCAGILRRARSASTSCRLQRGARCASRLGTALQHFASGASEAALEPRRRRSMHPSPANAAPGMAAGDRHRGALDSGQRDRARSELQQLEAAEHVATRRSGDAALSARLARCPRRGRFRRAERTKAAAETALEAGLPWLECIARAALARLLADAGDSRGRETQLRNADALAERAASASLRFVVRLAAAEAALAAGVESAALEAVKGAFALGREHGLRHAPWWRGQPVADLCALALRHGIEPEYARALAREAQARSAAAAVAHSRLAVGIPDPHVRRLPAPARHCAVEFGGKGPGRPLELLKVLIALGGENVRADQLADALWPHVEADFAHKSFTAALQPAAPAVRGRRSAYAARRAIEPEPGARLAGCVGARSGDRRIGRCAAPAGPGARGAGRPRARGGSARALSRAVPA
jgi:hypothetical protein